MQTHPQSILKFAQKNHLVNCVNVLRIQLRAEISLNCVVICRSSWLRTCRAALGFPKTFFNSALNCRKLMSRKLTSFILDGGFYFIQNRLNYCARLLESADAENGVFDSETELILY